MVTPRAVFQENNARPHRARLTTAFLTANNINTLPCPSLSPDLNPVEHIWDELDGRLRARANASASPNELFIASQAEWAAIPQQKISHIITPMPHRCRATIAAKGGNTRY
jgi:transposase